MVMQRLYISNKDRIQGISYDFLLSDITSMFGNTSTFRAKVVQVDFENYATTIIKGQNDTFNYTLTNDILTFNISIVFPEGFYAISGPSSILSLIQAQQDAQAGAGKMTWSYDTNTRKISLTTATANYYVTMTKPIDPVYPYQQNNSQLRNVEALGLDNFVFPLKSTKGPIGTVSTGSGLVDYSTSAYMDVVVNLPNQCFSTSNLNRMIIARVPVDTAYGFMVAYQPLHPLEFLINTQQMNNLRVTLFNQWNQYYVLPDNANFSMVLQLEPAE